MSIADAMPTLNENDHILGSLSADLLLMTYGSYPCPRTGKAHQAIENIRESLGEKICFIYRHFPLIQLYPQAQKTAETAEAAGNQGKFWEMHYTLLENQQHLDDADLVAYANDLGLDVVQFLQELSTHLHAARIQLDKDSGLQYGVKETPTFFISVRHEGTENLETFVKKIVDAATASEPKSD